MRSLLIAVAISFCCVVVHAQKDKYTDKYDNMNVDEILSNKRLLSVYINCVSDKGRCTPEGRELKSHIIDALQTGCSKCTDSQRQAIKKIIKYLINNEHEAWNHLVELYDPKKVYTKKYENQLQRLRG